MHIWTKLGVIRGCVSRHDGGVFRHRATLTFFQYICCFLITKGAASGVLGLF